MSPFTFADGTHVPKDNWVCVPHLPLMTDPATYPDPDTFDGFRFVSKDGTDPQSRFSHTSWSFPYWGSVKQGWSVQSLFNTHPCSASPFYQRLNKIRLSTSLANHLCLLSPARFYVSMAVKMIVIQFLENYDFKLAKQNIPTTLSYDIMKMPHPFLAILVRERRHAA